MRTAPDDIDDVCELLNGQEQHTTGDLHEQGIAGTARKARSRITAQPINASPCKVCFLSRLKVHTGVSDYRVHETRLNPYAIEQNGYTSFYQNKLTYDD